MIGETAQIIQFAAIRPKVDKYGARAASEPVSDCPRTAAGYPRSEDVSDTCKNQRIRQKLHANWLRADALRNYWRASLEFTRAISRLQSYDMPEGDLHPQSSWGDDGAIVAKYRATIMQQLLTPASTAAEITWKRAAFKSGQHLHTDVKPERIERAIADDVEFLKAHPTRRSLGSNSDA